MKTKRDERTHSGGNQLGECVANQVTNHRGSSVFFLLAFRLLLLLRCLFQVLPLHAS